MDQIKKPSAITSFTLPQLIALAGGNKDQWLMGECVSANTESRLEEFRFPCRIDAFIIGVGTEGETTTSFNLQEYTLRKDTLFVYSPNDIIQVHSDARFQAHALAVSTDFMGRLHIDFKQMMPLLMQFGSHPCVELTPDQSQTLRNFIALTEQEVRGSEGPFSQDIISGLISATIYKIGDILRRYLDEHPEERFPVGSRAESYFRQFMALLDIHYKRERSVGFYARQLCVTPKYLTTLIKRISGKSVSEWIDSYVVLEAKTLLKYSDKSVQEIAYHLNFPNQSFFGCYFKRNTGVSPSQYKGEN